MKIQDEIKDSIKEALKKLNIDVDFIHLEAPADISFGDYSSNVAMVIAKREGKNVREFAQQIRDLIIPGKYIEKIEVAGPGFLNFFLNKKAFIKIIKSAVQEPENFGKSDLFTGRNILVEHSSPNLFKPFHIGHLVNNSYGEAVVRTLSFLGANVSAVSFPSDISPGIAKAVWALIKQGKKQDFGIKDLGEAYVLGVRAYEDLEIKSEIDKINESLYNKNKNSLEWKIYKKGRELSLRYFLDITDRLGSKFDELLFESEAEKLGKQIVKENTPAIFEKSDNAIIFRGSEYGLYDNVFVNSQGFGTYLTKDIGLIKMKFDKFNFDKSITITDIEQKQHFELVKKSAELINKEWAEKSEYLQHGRLSLSTGKISSRDGGVPLAEELIDNVKKEAINRMNENGYQKDDKIAEQIALAAFKYAILRVGMGKNIVFDLEASTSFEGDSGPYLQYTYARAKSILKKYNSDIDTSDIPINNVAKLLVKFGDVVERAGTEFAPHKITNYLTQLAGEFNSWYASEKIMDGSNDERAKIALTYAVSVTLKNGAKLLGFNMPEHM